MPTPTSRSIPRLLGAALLAFLGACQDEVPPPSAVVAVGEATLAGTVGDLLPTPLTVKVTDAKGKPLGGVAVTFAVAEGGGSVSNAVDTTNVAGTAATSWRLGERAGAQRVTASVAGVTGQVSFTATARPGAPASIAANGGNQQTVVVGTAVLSAPSVIVRDRFTNPVPGVSVLFTVATGGGSVTGSAGTTNSAGVAAVGEWKMGTVVGTNTLTALALGSGITGNPVTFTATATAGAAAVITAPGGTSLSGIVFRAMSPVPQVRVADASGNPVSGATVTFTGSTGSTVVPTGGTKTTDANGLAAPDGWVLGTTVANYTLTAAVSGAPSLVITAAARADTPSAMTITAGNNQTVQAGRAVPIEPSVRVTDVHGNVVAGVEVLFEVGSGGGTAVGRRATTNAQGTATVGGWTLGDAVGVNTLVASVTTAGVSVPAVTFTATATAGSAATMAASAGQNQSAPAGTAVATAPAVVVRDARGNPVSGVAVTFSVGSGNGTVTGGTATTNSAGVAAVGSWVLGSAVGTQTLVARSGTLSEVTFTATATAGAAARIAAWSSQSQINIVAGSSLTVSQRPAVRVTDVEGNPVSGVAVTFRVAQSGASGYLGGSDTVSTATTNANGIATVGAWVVPSTANVTATATASVSGVAETVDFQVATIPGAVARLVITSGGLSTLTATAGTTYPITITARDANNNVVTGYTGAKTLTFSGASAAISGTAPTAGGTAFATAFSATFASGVVTLNLVLYRAEVAIISVTDGSVSSGDTGRLTATVASASAASLSKVAGDNQTASATTNVATAPSVQLVDTWGNAVSTAGVTVSFAVTAGGGTVTPASVATNASGRATVTSWQLGPIGAQSLTASSAGLISTIFTATAN